MDLLKLIFTGGFAAAALKIFFDFLNTKKTKMDSLISAEMISMQDRIVYLGKAYIHDGRIEFEDRRRLSLMHDAYKGLGGNGDLDELMKDVYELPLS